MVIINPILKKIYKKIKKYDDIVIARHIGPDPDAVASEIALRDSIKATFPDKRVLAIGIGVAKFRYFGNLDKISVADLNDPLLIMLDLPSTSRLDGTNKEHYKEIIKIDHHPFEEKNGEVEWIDETASSTCEMIAELIINTKLKLTENIARNLFLGTMSDSERFLFLPNPSKTFKVMGDLLKEYNLPLDSLYNSLYERPLDEIRFQGFLATSLKVNENGFAYLKISEDDIKEYDVDMATASNSINSFNFIKEVIVWVFVTYDKQNELFKINIRSRGPVINEIATKYNGGGHKMASGCRIKTEEEVDSLLKELDEECRKYKDEQDENRQI